MKFEEELDKTKQKIYYFFGNCEFITVCEADSRSEALKEYLQTNPNDKFDLILEFNKKDANHTIYEYFNQIKEIRRLKKIINLRHRR